MAEMPLFNVKKVAEIGPISKIHEADFAF